MRGFVNIKCTHLCDFFINQGYKSLNRKLPKTTDDIKKMWAGKYYDFMVDDIELILNYIASKDFDDNENLYEIAFFIKLTELLDALTLKPTAGFYGVSNSTSLKNNKNYYNRKVLTKMQQGISILDSIIFSKDDKKWLGALHTRYLKQINDLNKTILDIESRRSQLAQQGASAAGWLIQHFNENQKIFSQDFIQALISDLRENNVKVYNVSKFKYKNIKKTVDYKKSFTWINEEIAKELKSNNKAIARKKSN